MLHHHSRADGVGRRRVCVLAEQDERSGMGWPVRRLGGVPMGGCPMNRRAFHRSLYIRPIAGPIACAHAGQSGGYCYTLATAGRNWRAYAWATP